MRALAREGRGGDGRRVWRLVLWVSSLALAAVAANPVRAHAGEAAAPPDGRGFVQLAVAGSDDDASALVEALRELVGRLGLGLHAARADASPWTNGAPPTDRGERARVFIDDRFADRIEITMSAVKDGILTASVRRSVPRAESTAIVVEQVAYAVHSTLESLLTTGAPPPEPSVPPEPNAAPVEPPAVVVVPAPPVETQPVRPPGRRSNFSMDATAFASGRVGIESSAAPVIGAGGAVDLTAWRGRWRPSLWVAGSNNATFGTQYSGFVRLATSVTSLRVVPSVELFEFPFLQVDAGAGGGVDAFYTDPSNPNPTAPNFTVARASPSTYWDPVLSGQLVARIRFLSSARILVGFDVDYDVVRPSYTANKATSGIYATVLQPALVRPSAMIGLCVPLVGTLACSGTE